jgi:hypothetical protein
LPEVALESRDPVLRDYRSSQGFEQRGIAPDHMDHGEKGVREWLGPIGYEHAIGLNVLIVHTGRQ